jgi:hypothetical protein
MFLGTAFLFYFSNLRAPVTNTEALNFQNEYPLKSLCEHKKLLIANPCIHLFTKLTNREVV